MTVSDKKEHKVLIIEDEEALRNVLVDEFRKEGFYAISAADGQTGLDLAFAEKPDIILLDIVMPVMDGMTMLKRLKGDPWGQTVPVVILTNLSASKKVVEAMENGIYEYMVKAQVDISDIVKSVRAALRVL